jgi:hypothetical protein
MKGEETSSCVLHIISNSTTDMGVGVSANAIRQRVSKLKNLGKQLVAGTDTDITLNTGSTPASTPKRAAAPRTKKTLNKGANTNARADDEASPSKKLKTHGNTKAGKGHSMCKVSTSGDDEAHDEAEVKAEENLGAESQPGSKFEASDYEIYSG